jgi:hypothetical protein
MIYVVLEISVFFLFTGGMLYLLFSGRLGDMVRDRAPKPLLLIALISAIAIYHWVSLLQGIAALPDTSTAAPRVVVPIPEPAGLEQEPVKRQVNTAARSVAAKPPSETETSHWKTIVVDDALAPNGAENDTAAAQEPAPAAPKPVATPAPLPTTADPYESKSKRALKAVGHFLRYRKSDP